MADEYECPNCGNSLLKTEKRCRYCNSANPYYKEETKQEIVVVEKQVQTQNTQKVSSGDAPLPSDSGAASYSVKNSTEKPVEKKSSVDAGAVVLVILVGLWTVIKWLGKAIAWIFIGFFKLIGWIFKAIFDH